MSHYTLSAPAPALALFPTVVAVTVFAASAVMVTPASAEPRPWHDPEYVAADPAPDNRCDTQAPQASGQAGRRTDASCRTLGTTVRPQPNKAQIEYRERLAMAQPNKAQIEYRERLAMPQPNKAQIEYRERLAMPQPNKAQIEYQERLAIPQPNKAQIEYRERLALAAGE